jgi:hypothetical protein
MLRYAGTILRNEVLSNAGRIYPKRKKRFWKKTKHNGRSRKFDYGVSKVSVDILHAS